MAEQAFIPNKIRSWVDTEFIEKNSYMEKYERSPPADNSGRLRLPPLSAGGEKTGRGQEENLLFGVLGNGNSNCRQVERLIVVREKK